MQLRNAHKNKLHHGKGEAKYYEDSSWVLKTITHGIHLCHLYNDFCAKSPNIQPDVL